MMRLLKKSDADVKSWLDGMWEAYAKEVEGAGFTPEEAKQNVERNEKSLIVDGKPNADQHIFDIIDGDVMVGTLWLAKRGESGPGEWFVCDVVVDEAFRGKGLGRRAMEAAEDFVKSQGGTKLGLNVFGPNTVARRLYRSMGCQIMAIGMKKDLT